MGKPRQYRSGCLSRHIWRSLPEMPCESLGDPGYRWTPPWLLPGLRFFVDALPFSLPRLCRGPQPPRALHVAPPVGQWLGLLHGLLRPPRPPAYSVPFRVVAAGFLLLRAASTQYGMLLRAAAPRNSHGR